MSVLAKMKILWIYDLLMRKKNKQNFDLIGKLINKINHTDGHGNSYTEKRC